MQIQLDLLIRLLLAHILADFIFQPDAFLKNKSFKSPSLYIHGLIAGFLAYLFIFDFSEVWIFVVIFVSHVIIDGFKSMSKNGSMAFILDQLSHIIIIVICWILLTGINVTDFIKNDIDRILFTRILIYVLSFALIIWPANVLIYKSTRIWKNKDNGLEKQDAKDGSKYIGYLERTLILIFILSDIYEIIGFLIAAKSIFRFRGSKEADDNKKAEYILIGTLLSFLISILIGLMAKSLLESF